MIAFCPPEWLGQRVTCQLIPDTTGKIAKFHDDDQPVGEPFTLPIVGWAVVMILNHGTQPLVVVEPVVDEECHGPIALGDLQVECPFLELDEVL